VTSAVAPLPSFIDVNRASTLVWAARSSLAVYGKLASLACATRSFSSAANFRASHKRLPSCRSIPYSFCDGLAYHLCFEFLMSSLSRCLS
jgi:hypothetical protein